MSTMGHGSDVQGARAFPEGFVWGVGTSSYQIEGAVAADGRGRSIWDVFAHTAGNVYRGDTGDTVCDSYNRMDDDVRLLGDLGVGAYRFSIWWPRVLPEGAGPINQALDSTTPPGGSSSVSTARGLASRVATVYHWDLPQAPQDRGN